MLLFLSLLLSWPGACGARRLLPTQATTSAPHGLGASGGLHMTPHSPLSSQHAAEEQEVPGPLDVWQSLAEGSSDESSIEAEGHAEERAAAPANLDFYQQRVRSRGGAPILSWKCEPFARGKLVKRLRARTEQDRFALENELKAITKLRRAEVFLKFDATFTEHEYGSHVASFILTDDYSGTLRDLLVQYNGKLDVLTALDLFIAISDDLSILRHKRIAHDSPLAEEVLIVGNLQDLSTCHTFLCSSLTNTNLRICSWRASLGRILSFQDSQKSRARMLSGSEIESANLNGLLRLLRDIVDALDDDEAERLSSVVESSVIAEPSNDIGSRAKSFRNEWLRLYPINERRPRFHKRARGWRQLVANGAERIRKAIGASSTETISEDVFMHAEQSCEELEVLQLKEDELKVAEVEQRLVHDNSNPEHRIDMPGADARAFESNAVDAKVDSVESDSQMRDDVRAQPGSMDSDSYRRLRKRKLWQHICKDLGVHQSIEQ